MTWIRVFFAVASLVTPSLRMASVVTESLRNIPSPALYLYAHHSVIHRTPVTCLPKKPLFNLHRTMGLSSAVIGSMQRLTLRSNHDGP